MLNKTFYYIFLIIMQKRKYPDPKRWFPKNPHKYKGDVDNIWYRSSYELKYLKWLDTDPRVIEYNSEEIIVPYISPIDNRWHKYYIDFWAKMKDKNGNINTYLIEIKPYHQTKPPEVKKRITKAYINEVATWGVNDAKWNAARAYCRQRNWKFLILTEKELYGK
jgi:hypothetical protein